MLERLKAFVEKKGESLIERSHRLSALSKKRKSSLWSGSAYVTTYPDVQNALDIFAGEWWSSLPSPLHHKKAGTMGLADDPRLHWMFSRLGSIEGWRILELGPLEGAHTYMLQQAGAGSILAIEGNVRSYLKCLVMKESLKLNRASFLCGDFLSYLRTSEANFDLCVASGVLYHLTEPAELIALAAKRSKKLFLWTHYFDDKLLQRQKGGPRCTRAPERNFAGFRYTPYRQGYGRSLLAKNFSGGQEQYSHWMRREDILSCLKFFGYQNIEIALENRDTLAGPNFSLLATH